MTYTVRSGGTHRPISRHTSLADAIDSVEAECLANDLHPQPGGSHQPIHLLICDDDARLPGIIVIDRIHQPARLQ